MDEHLLGLDSVVAQARARMFYLHDAPQDAEVRREVVRLVGAIVGHADREGWHALGDLAGPMVRLLATRRGDESVFEALDLALGEIERLVHDRNAYS